MSAAIDNLNAAMQRAAAIRPKVGGFPYLAESLRLAGVAHDIWSLPSCQSLFLTGHGPVMMQGGLSYRAPWTCRPLIRGP
jgi:uncharacterized protein YbcV (DUF1398 family)